MDFNDIKSRLERLYVSIDARIDTDVLGSVTLKHEKTGTGGLISLSFNKGGDAGSSADDLNKILNIIHNLANLKDHLKNRILKDGKKAKLIEDQINNSDYLKIIIDLSNQEKHGYPLTKLKRSNKDPKIINIKRGFGVSQGNCSASFIFNPISGEVSHENGVIYISADIVDSNNVLLYSLDDLVKGGLAMRENIISLYNLAS